MEVEPSGMELLSAHHTGLSSESLVAKGLEGRNPGRFETWGQDRGLKPPTNPQICTYRKCRSQFQGCPPWPKACTSAGLPQMHGLRPPVEPFTFENHPELWVPLPARKLTGNLPSSSLSPALPTKSGEACRLQLNLAWHRARVTWQQGWGTQGGLCTLGGGLQVACQN